MSIKINLKELLYVFVMIFMMDVYCSVFRLHNIYLLFYPISIVLILIYILKISVTGKLDSSLSMMLKNYVIPFGIVTLISCLSARFVWKTTYTEDITQSILRWVHTIGICAISYYSYKIFGKKSIKLILIGSVISYSTVLIKWIANSNFSNVLDIFNSSHNNVSLEAHGLVETMGLLFIYYLLINEYSKMQKIKILIIIGTILFLGNKRVVFMGLIISLLVYFLLNKFKSKHMIILNIILIVFLLVTLGYLWFIKSNLFELILSYFGNSGATRLKFWNYFANDYTLSPFYCGKGLQYTDNRMVMGQAYSTLGIDSKLTLSIHNDILRVYIGWGMIPFIYYFYNFYVRNMNRIKNYNINSNSWKYFAIASYCFVIYMGDYMITYIPFNICLQLIVVLLANENGIEQTQLKR